jgi:hypothetical protein
MWPEGRPGPAPFRRELADLTVHVTTSRALDMYVLRNDYLLMREPMYQVPDGMARRLLVHGWNHTCPWIHVYCFAES